MMPPKPVGTTGKSTPTLTNTNKIWEEYDGMGVADSLFAMDPRDAPRIGIIDYWRQLVPRDGYADRLLVRLGDGVRAWDTYRDRLKTAPFSYWLTFALTAILGILGIVPGDRKSVV